MKMRAAVAGAGSMGFWHAQNIVRAGGKVAAVCDVDEGAARRLAKRCKGARAAVRLEETLERDKIDVLHICTPLRSHFELASAALTRGIHVLVEKPMTSDCAETERLYALATEHGVLLCPVHQFPFQRGVRKALSEFGRISQLRHFEATFCSAGGVGKSKAELDAIVAEILPHPLSLMQRFVPESLREEGWTVIRPAPGEFRAMLTAQGICFSILVSLNSRPTMSALRLLGTAGTIQIDLFHGFCVIEPGKVSRWRKIVHPFDLSTRTLFAAGANIATRALTAEPAYPGLRALIERFYSAIAANSEPPIRHQEALEIAAVCDALRKASEAASLSTRPL
jgi:predicted dehydrogenase